MVFCVTCWW